jgi:hypothetical protein
VIALVGFQFMVYECAGLKLEPKTSGARALPTSASKLDHAAQLIIDLETW